MASQIVTLVILEKLGYILVRKVTSMVSFEN